MPRSSHSCWSYFNCRLTGSPHLLQKSGVFLLYVPHFWHSTSLGRNGSVITMAPQCTHAVRRWCRPFRWPHLHSQLPIEKSTKSNCEMPRKSVIGNTDTNTDCKPESSRSFGSLSICRKRSYERRCTSIRLGIWVAVGIFEKSSRLRIARFSLGMFTPEARDYDPVWDRPAPESRGADCLRV